MRSRAMAVGLMAAGLLLAAGMGVAQGPTGLAGNWAGAFDMVHGDGSVDQDKAYFTLAVNGGTVTGSAGSGPTQMKPIQNGTVEGSHVRFSVQAHDSLTVTLDLTLEGGHLRGNVTGLPLDPGTVVKVDAVPADAAWHPTAKVEHVPDQLYQEVAALDTKLFNAYNSCDLDTLRSMVAEDLEFYHDKDGLAVGRQHFLDAIKNNICGQTQRTLVPGTLEVHRLAHYGAVEMGVHRFSHPGHPELDPGEAKFTTIWQWKDGRWTLTRAISYDHEPLKQ